MSADNAVGLFPVSYVVGTGLPGAPTLRLNLLVDTPRRKVVGNATVTQAVSPPLDLHVDVWGEFTYMALMPPHGTRILVTVQGNSGGPTSNAMTTFRLYMVVGADWQAGIASYSYWSNGQWHEVESVPARVDHEFVPLEPGPVIPETLNALTIGRTLYGPAIQRARASGDLAHMKTLAAYVQQQLDSHQEIVSAHAALHAEIRKLEGRQ
ncbi:DUF1842 domain-containing protein [Ralstonia pseudosolanacearum]|uniref:DUF1842 domain-containing protein n=1 Tax=Ralstonia pseudosolanacearum TaxID=1310165 RepID=UPI000E572795|nr:DUF1842 domain-containing protein [Ralstonia pseudosolanacearum]AXV69551.1 hypothetical protein CJO74_09815 [Ralstonia solanacearum]AXV95724.1 hypothetical protein CJO80_09040 [Ralstonia solanacearum]AXW00917.1 hypothetical protein CJO81_09115 [Ralstonia solanacearum]AXW10555.1 hypothetical protein CJO83_08805 [Ralstonia solanacearum]AXW28406.1 hypothetical protein CJO87_09115 [Ralstonia solanacearum]